MFKNRVSYEDLGYDIRLILNTVKEIPIDALEENKIHVLNGFSIKTKLIGDYPYHHKMKVDVYDGSLINSFECKLKSDYSGRLYIDDRFVEVIPIPV
jgi:hypothetical protein